jgi:mannose/cellobiose epimerase-like protein (N-acyl-D-glucosamine 2-epimerase family)
MPPPAETLAEARLAALRGRLLEWLVDAAYPLWSRLGIDSRTGGFVEALSQQGQPLRLPRRVRVQPRQIYAFAHAPAFCWRGPAEVIVRRGVSALIASYRRADGVYRTLTDDQGRPLHDRGLLYDQSFVLLGFAAAAVALGARTEFEPIALELRDNIERRWRLPGGEFRSGDSCPDLREANPHMHLLEACLAWCAVGTDPDWGRWADDLAELAVGRFIRPAIGALTEAYAASWEPAPGLQGRQIEPGHQYEWAWLLLRSGGPNGAARRAAALRLIDVAENYGVRGGTAINALLDDFTVQDPSARLWPQTERLKAARLAARVTGDPRYWDIAANAAASLFPYLDTALPGLWFDVRLPGGAMADSPAPASSFYHLVCAIAELEPSPSHLGSFRR